MPPGIHSKLGPSKSESWINCPPCLKLTEDMEDEPSEYASAGTAAHELAEYKGKKILGLKVGSRPHSDYDSDEMEECTDMYADYLKELYDQAKLICQNPVTLFERHVEMDNYAPGSFGSCDFMLVADKKLHIVDLKYGYIEVQAKENTQMMMYALGALNLFDCLYDIEEVEMTIFQPRIQNMSSWNISVDGLVKWGNEVLKPAAELAAAGEGEFNPGPWCSHNFCKERTTCRARAEQMLELAKLEFKPLALLSDEELATVMDKADELSKWCSDVMTFATIQATEHGKSCDQDYCYVDYPAKIKAAGLNGYSKSNNTTPAKKSNVEIASEVIAGKWGNGAERKEKLTKAGYNYSEIQSIVNAKVGAPAKKSVDEIAKEVIRGDWGNGTERKARLTAAGYDYAAIQHRVNELLS